MFRIDGPGAVGELPSVREGVNSPGYFSGGDPATGRAATRVTYEWLNAVQEELGNVIRAAGIDLDKKSNSQLLAALAVLAAAPGDIIPPDNVTIRIENGKLTVSIDEKTLQIKDGKLTAVGGTSPYELCEIYCFRNPTLRPGFQPCQGGVIANANIKYPEAWEYLQTEEGQLLCKSEAEWQAMTQATWGSGTFKASWNGIGGAPYFVQNLEAGTLRMPDLRGMFACATDSTLAVGQAQGDCIRNATGNVYGVVHKGVLGYHGIMHSVVSSPSEYIGMNGSPSYHLQPGHLSTNLSAGIPTGPVITPKSWGTLVCAYLGQPAAA